MAHVNGQYKLDFEPLRNFFGGLFKPKPAKPAQPKLIEPKKPSLKQALGNYGSYYGQIKDIEKELKK